MKIGYLGPQGSYSHLAAQTLCPSCEAVAYASFERLFGALACGETEGVALPIENTLNGGVTRNIDLLQSSEGIVAVRECKIPIDHRLITLEGADPSRIKRIFSHGQALAQCSRYLAEHFPDAEQIETASTTQGAEMIKSPFDAGIVGSHVRYEGFTLSERCISDEPTNFTQFLLAVKGRADETVHTKKMYFSVTCRHAPGQLTHLLGILGSHGINMTKIESRPIKDRVGEYRFFIEIEGDYADAEVRNAVGRLKDASSSFKLLGCY